MAPELIDAEFGDWMESVQVKTFAGTGAWGETWADPVPVDAHWAFKQRVIVSAEGKSVTSAVQLQCGARYLPTFALGSTVTLPGSPREFTVVQVGSWPGEDSQLEVDLA